MSIILELFLTTFTIEFTLDVTILENLSSMNDYDNVKNKVMSAVSITNTRNVSEIRKIRRSARFLQCNLLQLSGVYSGIERATIIINSIRYVNGVYVRVQKMLTLLNFVHVIVVRWFKT